jgi:hypothetical protein
MLKSLAVALAVAVGIGSAQGRTVLGHGLTSCGGWTQAQGSERSSLETWVAGYLSSFNSLTGDANDPDFLKDEDWDGLIAWIDNYCSAHPDYKLETAARSLVIELVQHR